MIPFSSISSSSPYSRDSKPRERALCINVDYHTSRNIVRSDLARPAKANVTARAVLNPPFKSIKPVLHVVCLHTGEMWTLYLNARNLRLSSCRKACKRHDVFFRQFLQGGSRCSCFPAWGELRAVFHCHEIRRKLFSQRGAYARGSIHCA